MVQRSHSASSRTGGGERSTSAEFSGALWGFLGAVLMTVMSSSGFLLGRTVASWKLGAAAACDLSPDAGVLAWALSER